jgi:hypothetical protein
MISRKVLAKIKKLMALAGSDNVAEAESASSMVYQLLNKYKLSMAKIEQAPDIRESHSDAGGKTDEEMIWEYVQRLMREFFLVEIAQTRERVVSGEIMDIFKDGMRVDMVDCYVAFGEPSKVLVAGYACGAYMRTFTRMYHQYKNQVHPPPTVRKHYYLGFFKGIEEQLEEFRKKAQEDAINAGRKKAPSAGKGGVDEGPPMVKTITSATLKGADLAALKAGYATAKSTKVVPPPTSWFLENMEDAPKPKDDELSLVIKMLRARKD